MRRENSNFHFIGAGEMTKWQLFIIPANRKTEGCGGVKPPFTSVGGEKNRGSAMP